MNMCSTHQLHVHTWCDGERGILWDVGVMGGCWCKCYHVFLPLAHTGRCDGAGEGGRKQVSNGGTDGRGEG